MNKFYTYSEWLSPKSEDMFQNLHQKLILIVFVKLNTAQIFRTLLQSLYNSERDRLPSFSMLPEVSVTTCSLWCPSTEKQHRVLLLILLLQLHLAWLHLYPYLKHRLIQLAIEYREAMKQWIWLQYSTWFHLFTWNWLHKIHYCCRPTCNYMSWHWYR